MQPLGEIPARAGEPGQGDRLRQVRGDDRREREQQPDERLDGIVLEQLGARARDHHRIDDEGYRVLGEVAGDRLDQAPGEEHPGLRRVDADVGEDRVELGDHELGR